MGQDHRRKNLILRSVRKLTQVFLLFVQSSSQVKSCFLFVCPFRDLIRPGGWPFTSLPPQSLGSCNHEPSAEDDVIQFWILGWGFFLQAVSQSVCPLLCLPSLLSFFPLSFSLSLSLSLSLSPIFVCFFPLSQTCFLPLWPLSRLFLQHCNVVSERTL